MLGWPPELLPESAGGGKGDCAPADPDDDRDDGDVDPGLPLLPDCGWVGEVLPGEPDPPEGDCDWLPPELLES